MGKTNDDKKSYFLEKIKTKSKEFGVVITSELLDNLNQTTSLLQASLGNELVIATFAPMIPQLIFDEVKKRLFTIEITDLGHRISQVKQDLNHDFIDSDEGQKLFQKVVNDILNNAEQEKIEYLKRFITASFVLEDPEIIKLQKFKEILIQMTSLDVKLLETFCKPQEFISALRSKKEKLKVRDIASSQLVVPKDINNYHFKIEEGLFLVSCKSLSNWGLIQHKSVQLTKKDEIKPEDTDTYTLGGYWGLGQGGIFVLKDRRHARKILKKIQMDKLEDTELVNGILCALTMAFVTNFRWELMCMIDESIQPVSIDEDLELKR